jgi:hypothetical protein
MDHPAIYYPSRCSLMKARAVTGEALMFSNDHGCACHERRHMIDAAALEELEGGHALLESVVVPVPLCLTCGIIEMGQQAVVGMLKDPLVIRYHIKREGQNKGKRVEISLDQVLVIRQLPVPLHVSFKRLEDNLGESWPSWFGDMVNSGYNRDTSASFKAENVPERYRTHPFWNTAGHFIGMCSTTDAMTDELKAEESFIDTVSLVSCSFCGSCPQGVKLKRCGRCQRAHYCCKTHQEQHWPQHKKTCVSPSS